MGRTLLLTHLVSILQLGKLFHLLFLQPGRHLPHPVGQYLDDLMKDSEHGLRDDLKHLQIYTILFLNSTHTVYILKSENPCHAG